jgi:putative endonuclease
MDARREFGDAGENLAASFLVSSGMRLLDRNVNTPFGEVDLLCEDGDEIVFAEVKTRQSDEYGYPEESITPGKFRHMSASAESVLSERGWENRFWRLDVVAIRMLPGKEPEIVHLKAIDRPHGP